MTNPPVDDSEAMRRREWLALTGATVLGGCAGVFGNTTDRERLSLGEAVEYGTVTLAVTEAVATAYLCSRDAEVTAREGELFVLIFVEATNDAEQPASVPVPGRFEIESDRGSYDAETNVWRRLQEPVTGPLYRGVDPVEPGATRAGWIDFAVYREASDLRARIGGSERGGSADAAAWQLPEREALLVEDGTER